MGKLTFSMPANLPLEATQELERASVTGGPDAMPTQCQVQVEPGRLSVVRDAEESGCAIVPWSVERAGHLIVQTATLIERDTPYSLMLELARGKINQVRNQFSDWVMGGLDVPPALTQHIKDATRAFTQAVVRNDHDSDNPHAANALALAHESADQLVQAYASQVFQVRQQRQPRLETTLGCRLGLEVPTGDSAMALAACFNGVTIPMSIHDVAPAEGDYRWHQQTAVLDWAKQAGLTAWGGPLVDFSGGRLPSWLWLWEGDRGRIAKLLCEYTADVLEHFQDRIPVCQLTAASNLPGALSLNDDELLWLTVQMGETARRIAPGVGLVVGISQPWGDYLTEKERVYSPFVFADTLLRSGLPLAALDLEVVMGVSPRGSYCRDLLDFSRMLDLYALLGVPLQVTLGYPALADEDDRADAALAVSGGYWRSPISAQTQAEWAAAYGALALCKPFVRSVQWVQWSDAHPHQFPHCGIVDAAAAARPSHAALQSLREKYLR